MVFDSFFCVSNLALKIGLLSFQLCLSLFHCISWFSIPSSVSAILPSRSASSPFNSVSVFFIASHGFRFLLLCQQSCPQDRPPLLSTLSQSFSLHLMVFDSFFCVSNLALKIGLLSFQLCLSLF